MRDLKGKRYWLVGASEGLGRAVAKRLSGSGVRLVLSARSEGRLRELADELPEPADVVPLDVSERECVEAAAAEIGEIDGLVYLAGVYWPLGSREWNNEKNQAMADINYVGAIRTVGAVLPAMLERGRGHIVLTGSLSGFRGLPGAVAYGSSKAAVMYLAEALHADLRGGGIDVQVVNPGFVRTRLTDKNDFRMPFIMEPDEAAERYVAHMRSTRFKTSFPTVFSLIFRASQFLPDAIYYRLT